MTRTTQILALLISLLTLAVLAPTAGAATTPDPFSHADPGAWRWASVDPNPRFSPNPRFLPNPRFSPNPYRFVTPNPRFAPKARFAPTGGCYRC